jgi:hypothetical protein
VSEGGSCNGRSGSEHGGVDKAETGVAAEQCKVEATVVRCASDRGP